MKKIFRRNDQIPTDLKILDIIYNSYYDEFSSFIKENPTRKTKLYVPIDIQAIANELNVDGDVIFGRLYYHLEKKYGYTNEDNSKVYFFALKIGEDTHCVNFPYLASILAELQDNQKKYKTGTTIALISLGISIASIAVSLFYN